MTRLTQYDRQASEFLGRFGVTLSATFAGWVCPAFCGDDGRTDHVHGPRWSVTLERHGTPPLQFDYWSSYADSHGPVTRGAHRGEPAGRVAMLTIRWRDLRPDERRSGGGIVPSGYDVLTCLSGDVHCPETFADWCADYGYEEDSRRALAAFEACAELAAKVRAFFPEDGERDSLSEIQ